MKFLKFCFLIFLTFYAQAARVVLLSSIHTPKIWFHSKNWEIEDSLEKIFKNRFKDSGLEIVIKEKVDQNILWEELNNPENIALFWLSHSTNESIIASGINSDAAIVDYYGRDVKSLFTKIHPNLRFLGLVGCSAEGIISTFKEKGFYKNNPHLSIHSFSKKIEAKKGLRKAIEKSALSLGSFEKSFAKAGKVKTSKKILNEFMTDSSCQLYSKVLEANITRFTLNDSPSVSISNRDQIIDFLPAQKSGETKHYKIFIPADNIKSNIDLKLIIDSNVFYSKNRIDLGEIEVSGVNFIGQWKTFSKKDGTPMGITSNLLKFKGQTPSEDDFTERNLFSCLKL